MDQDRLPPIPTPASQRWREFRINVMPLVVFSGVVGVIVILWRQSGMTGNLAGVAEGVRSVVTSPQAGRIEQLRVRPYQMVQAGDELAVLQPRDPQAELGLLQNRVQLARLRSQPSIAERNAMNFEQIRIDLLRTKTELAMARVNLERAENEVRRNTPLFREKLLSEDLYDLSVKTRDMLRVEVETKAGAVQEIEGRMQALQALGQPGAGGGPAGDVGAGAADADWQRSLADLERSGRDVATNWGPLILRAPISGMVSLVHRQQGEHVAEGEPMILIQSDWADRIVGYLRQPYTVDPREGMPVHVATREQRPRRFWSEIRQVGVQLETITNSLAYVRQGALVDAGLPVVVDIPKGIRIRPGEAVDLAFRGKAPDSLSPVNGVQARAASGPEPVPAWDGLSDARSVGADAGRTGVGLR